MRGLVAEEAKHPRHARRAVDPHVYGVVDNQHVVLGDAEGCYAGREVCGGGKHLGVWRGGISDEIHVEEAALVSMLVLGG